MNAAPVVDHAKPLFSPTEKQKILALAGNPNVGKSVLFHALSGQYVQVSNFPGTTVSLTQAKLQGTQGEEVMLEDTPGVYGLSGLSDEEQVAESSLLNADAVLNVVSALTLKRDLFLTQQLLDWGLPLLVVVNQLDEAEARGLNLDLRKLETLLGVPVVGCVATTGEGVEQVKQRWPEACKGKRLSDLPENRDDLRALEKNQGSRLQLYGHRRHYVNQLVAQVLSSTLSSGQVLGFWGKLSKGLASALLHPVWGTLALVAVLLSLYQLIGVWVAGDLVGLLEGKLLIGYALPVVQKLVSLVLPVGSPFYELIAGEFGLLTMGPQYLLGVVFPLVLGFYLYLSILEDCGYLPRLAVLADGLLTRMGLNGRAMIPIILGLGCVTMATISTRVLTSQRERTIANALLAITIPCSAQLGVIMGMVAIAGGLRAWVVYLFILFGLFVGIGAVLNKLLPGKSSGLVLDLPPLRWPQPKNILKKTWSRSWGFMVEATPLFLIGAALVSVAQITGLLHLLEEGLAPVTEAMLQLPGSTASAFIMGMVRRDFGLAGFNALKHQLSPVQLMTSLVVITLFVPCIASATVLWKERGWKEGFWVLLTSWSLAFGVGAVVCRVLGLLPIL
jgi:ferrous iron transport protein B